MKVRVTESNRDAVLKLIELTRGRVLDVSSEAVIAEVSGTQKSADPLWDGWRVIRVNPHQGAIIDEIKLPVARPTSCCFGGANLDELYITTASTRMPAEELAKQPLAGGLFHCKPGVKGFPMVEFAG